MSKKQVKFMCTAFRDGFQSVFGTRVLPDDFFPAVEAARDAGITWFEAGGGAMFQSPVFYLNYDPYKMMRKFRDITGPDANLQTLSRGVNIVALDSASSDVIRLHAQLFKKYGISTIRNFDALNDVDNLIHSGRCIHEAGLKHQVVVTLMSLPPKLAEQTTAHTPEFYEKTLRGILDAGIPYDSVCFKDASGTATPAVVYETVKRARKMLPAGTHIHFHTHETAGCSVLCNKAAIDAGADAVDLSMAPVSGGTCSPDIIAMWHALRGTDYELAGIADIEKVRKAEQVFRDALKDYEVPPEALAVEPNIPFSPMPGGALTANTQMLRDNGMLDKYGAMLDAMSEVVAKGGFGTSVTPVSQFYAQQAFNNAIYGPWKKIAPGYGKMVLGYFGKTPAAPDPEIVKICAEQCALKPTTDKVLEINDKDPKKSVAHFKKTLEDNNLPTTDENIFLLASCGDKGLLFLQGKATVNGVRKNVAKEAAKEKGGTDYTITINGAKYAVKLGDGSATVNGAKYEYGIKDGIVAEASSPSTVSNATGGKDAAATTFPSPVPGLVLRVTAGDGSTVSEGDEVLVLEAMKMEMPMKATASGKVSLSVAPGSKVNSGDILFKIV
ncbi:MAG: biotin attachment protein [Kiritimatiellaeota bacterium]|nr:biotin attachment protein [Kiritimatiellota bacterium]